MESVSKPTRPGTSHVRYWIVAMLFLLTTINFADRSAMSIAGSAIKTDLGISNVELSPFDLRQSFLYNSKLGREATTHVRPLQSLRGATLVECRLETGRTHQIRIHLSEAGHPLVGERVYSKGYRGTLLQAPRLMLHAAELGFVHPQTEESLSFEEPLPADMQAVLTGLSR